MFVVIVVVCMVTVQRECDFYFSSFNCFISASCIADCFDDNTKVASGSKLEQVLETVTAQSCQDACAGETTCLFFTWGSSAVTDTDTDQYTCTLYSSVVNTSDSAGYVTGTKSCTLNETRVDSITPTRELLWLGTNIFQPFPQVHLLHP